MTGHELFENYKTGAYGERTLFLADFHKSDGFAVRSETDFENILEYFAEHDIFIMSLQENDEMVYCEYFIMDKSTPKIALIRHPALANAYWKEAPDRIIDVHVVSGNVYRYIGVDYGKLLKDLVIELPTAVDKPIWTKLRKMFPGALGERPPQGKSDFSYSIVFTNTDRYDRELELGSLGFKVFPLDYVYGPRKRHTIKTVSMMIWKELKA